MSYLILYPNVKFTCHMTGTQYAFADLVNTVK